MNIVSKLLTRCIKFRSFRILLAKIYPILNRLRIIKVLQRINKGSFSDSWGHFKDYDSLEKKYVVDFNKLVKQRKEYTFGFLTNGIETDTDFIIKPFELLGVKCLIYDISDASLYKNLAKCSCDGMFIHPVYSNNLTRTLYHEAVQILSTETRLKIYPTIRELNIHDSKRSLANFLAINNIPHPTTNIFYDYTPARDFILRSEFPLIFKTHIGASSSGVEILRDKQQALRLAGQLFNKYYLRKLEIDKRSTEWGYMILQKYIENAKEFRIIKVGDSWFGYQKWKNEDQDFMSGSGVQKWINPSEMLLDFCYDIAVRYSFNSMCFDIFENKKGEYLVNELQTWFGSYDPTEMCVDNIPGRYRKIEGKWTFEPGYYNIYGSNLLRLIHFISILQET